jgi:hypothetical protein
MKWIAVREVRQNLKRTLEDAQKDGVVVMVHGAPEVVILGVRGRSIDEVYAQSPEFWRIVERRIANSHAVPLEQAAERMEAAWGKQARAKRASPPSSSRAKAPRAKRPRRKA